MIIILLAFFNYFTEIEPTYNWALEIKNENSTDEVIEFRPGSLTKVILIVHNESNIDTWERLFDKANYTIAVSNYNFRFYPDYNFNIIPSFSLEYIAYIGLSCNHVLEDGQKLTLDLNIQSKHDLDGNWFNVDNFIINPPQIIINNSPTIIDIEPIKTNLAAKEFSLFKISNEIYNIDKIKIKPENYNNEKYQIDYIEIKSVFKRKKFEKEENDNHGILFDYIFGTPTEYDALNGEINQSFELKMDIGYEWYKRVCLEIGSKSKIVDLTINKNKIQNLNESVKEAILYSMENMTPKRNKTNNIKFK
jgi:hypothetical protein